MMNYISEHKEGLISTIITHAAILLLLCSFGILTSIPQLPTEEGLLVNFGNSETGLGLEEPAPGDLGASADQENVTAAEAIPAANPVKHIENKSNDDEIVTQDIEKTVVLKTTEKKKTPKIDPEKLHQQEQDRLEKAEATHQKVEEEKRLAQAAAEQKKIGEINSRAKNVFGGGGKGTPDSKSTSQGITYGSGNQGVPGGSANVDRYGPGGGLGNGVSFTMDGRTAQSLPKPNYPGNEEGVVIVRVTVDKKGLVQKAEAGVRGSTTTNPELVAAAKKAALMAKFNIDGNAPAFQVGSITYRFVLD